MNILVVHASRHGGTAGIAERIAEVLTAEGLHTVLAKAEDLPDPKGIDACVIGSGVYMGSWLKEGTAYLERYATTLATRPVWLFSSGPLLGSSAEKRSSGDLVEDALGPLDGPGSGGRKKVEGYAATFHARGHRVFHGAFDPKDPPRVLSERLVRLMPASKGLLPPGDYRPWDAIEAWAREIATALREPVTVG